MAEGLRIINDAGTIQIDENLSCQELLAAGTATFGPCPEPNPNARTPREGERVPYWTHLLDIPMNGGRFIFWVSPIPISLFGYRDGHFQVGASRRLSDANGVSFRYFIFGEPRQDVPETHGLVVRDANGRVVFNSNRRYLKLVDVRNVDNTGSLAGFGARQYATSVLQDLRWYEQYRASGDMNFYNRQFWSLYANHRADGYDWHSLLTHVQYTGQNLQRNVSKTAIAPGYGIVALADVSGF